MTTTMTPEIREELLSLLREELEQQEERKQSNKTVYRRVCAHFDKELNAFTYTKTGQGIDHNGKPYQYVTTYTSGYKIREAVGSLLRVIFEVDAIAKLPAEKEEKIREFMGSVLALMRELKQC